MSCDNDTVHEWHCRQSNRWHLYRHRPSCDNDTAHDRHCRQSNRWHLHRHQSNWRHLHRHRTCHVTMTLLMTDTVGRVTSDTSTDTDRHVTMTLLTTHTVGWVMSDTSTDREMWQWHCYGSDSVTSVITVLTTDDDTMLISNEWTITATTAITFSFFFPVTYVELGTQKRTVGDNYYRAEE